MELNDVVYLILMAGFVVFGIFNDSKKKKNKPVDTSTKPLNKDVKDVRELFRDLIEQAKQVTPPPVPKEKLPQRDQPLRRKRFETNINPIHGFESSMNLVTNFEEESSLKGYNFVSENMEVLDISDDVGYTHPILKGLSRGDRHSEFKKAIIYSEIMNRRY